MTIGEFKKLIENCDANAEIDLCIIRNNLTAYESLATIDVDDCGDEVVFNISEA